MHNVAAVDLYIVRHGRPERQVVTDEAPPTPAFPTSAPSRPEGRRVPRERGHPSRGVVHDASRRRDRGTTRRADRDRGRDARRHQESDYKNPVYIPAEEMSREDPDSAHMYEGDLHAQVFSDGIETFTERVNRGFATTSSAPTSPARWRSTATG
ncbi:MAG: hypothetical protein R2695_02810 [Acidimicrobiales bacterium]